MIRSCENRRVRAASGAPGFPNWSFIETGAPEAARAEGRFSFFHGAVNDDMNGASENNGQWAVKRS